MGKTIAAIATGQTVGGIGIVRLSGDEARGIADRVFTGKHGGLLRTLSGYRARLGRVRDGQGWEDDAVALVFAAPHSYTGEDVVELSCHGGLHATRTLLKACLAAGASPAAPGEFTRRAFENGKLSLTQAEAVMAVVSAEGAQASRAAMAAMDGKLARRNDEILNTLTGLAARLEVWCDFPDDDLPEITNEDIISGLSGVQDELHALLRESEIGRLTRDGIDTVLAGRPNVGKSTLMNLLAGRARSIVTDIPGTTRDIIEERVTLDGCTLVLADTAGLRDTSGQIEAIGVDLARRRIESAALILAVFDASEELSDEDIALIDRIKDRPAVAIINKTDKPKRINDAYITKRIQNSIFVSAATGEGADEITRAIRRVTELEKLDASAGILINERQIDCARRALGAVEEALAAARGQVTLDAVTVLIEGGVAALLELSGGNASERIIDSIFANFCVGK